MPEVMQLYCFYSYLKDVTLCSTHAHIRIEEPCLSFPHQPYLVLSYRSKSGKLATVGLQISGNFIFGNVGRGVLVQCRNASTGPSLVSLPWPLFQNYNGPLLASHDGASMAAGTDRLRSFA